jgi:multidrug resistance efflux pump
MKHVSEDEIYVSNTQLVDELLVKIDDSYYRVDLSQDGQSFTLAKKQLVNTDIVLVTQ